MKTISSVVMVLMAMAIAGCGAQSTKADGIPEEESTPTPGPQPTAAPQQRAQLKVESFSLAMSTPPDDPYEPNDAGARYIGGPGALYDVFNARIEPVEATFTVDLINVGNAAAAAFDVDLFTAGAPTAGGQRGAQTQPVTALPAGAATSLSYTVKAGDTAAALKSVVKLDTMDAIVEADETDNLSSELQAALGVKDVDWFSFDEYAGEAIEIRLENLPADFDLELYDKNGTKVASSSAAGTTNERIAYTTTITGRYYVKVFGFQGAASETAYRLLMYVP